jgi:hypothetical protein
MHDHDHEDDRADHDGDDDSAPAATLDVGWFFVVRVWLHVNSFRLPS